jgi:hypothetical protein
MPMRNTNKRQHNNERRHDIKRGMNATTMRDGTTTRDGTMRPLFSTDYLNIRLEIVYSSWNIIKYLLNSSCGETAGISNFECKCLESILL